MAGARTPSLSSPIFAVVCRGGLFPSVGAEPLPEAAAAGMALIERLVESLEGVDGPLLDIAFW